MVRMLLEAGASATEQKNVGSVVAFPTLFGHSMLTAWLMRCIALLRPVPPSFTTVGWRHSVARCSGDMEHRCRADAPPSGGIDNGCGQGNISHLGAGEYGYRKGS